MDKVNTNLMILETERDQTKLRLKNQMESLKRTLDNLENKLEVDEILYEQDGLQGEGFMLDVYLTKFITYNRAIQRFNAHLEQSK